MRFRPGRPPRRPGGPFHPGPFHPGPPPPPPFGPRHPPPPEPDALRALHHANELFMHGDPAAAAPVYAQLARGAKALGRPRQAARLHLEAAQCWALVRNGPLVLEQGHAALGVLQGVAVGEAMYATFGRLLATLRQHNLLNEAASLEHAWQTQFGAPTGGGAPPPVGTPAPAGAAPRGHLPAKCPACGGTVRNDEVAWIDDQSAECGYCGSTLYLES